MHQRLLQIIRIYNEKSENQSSANANSAAKTEVIKQVISCDWQFDREDILKVKSPNEWKIKSYSTMFLIKPIPIPF